MVGVDSDIEPDVDIESSPKNLSTKATSNGEASPSQSYNTRSPQSCLVEGQSQAQDRPASPQTSYDDKERNTPSPSSSPISKRPDIRSVVACLSKKAEAKLKMTGRENGKNMENGTAES